MLTTPRTLIAGNWKMNGTRADLATLDAVSAGVSRDDVDVLVCPPAQLLAAAVERASGTRVAIGAQDCHAAASGAHTGDISAAMLADVGATAVIVGHSERRSDHGERDRDVAAKANAVIGAGMTAIVCVGETAGQREAGLAEIVAIRQMRASLPQGATSTGNSTAHPAVVIAYEPVWAIGTGLVATPDDVAAMHAALRAALVADFGDDGAAVQLLYGGSVKPDNAAALLSIDDVNGALVGGASLKAEDFLGIIAAAP
ncbi:MAG: triose-phosphate isomerase [Pseudomonadota bacterium]